MNAQQKHNYFPKTDMISTNLDQINTSKELKKENIR